MMRELKVLIFCTVIFVFQSCENKSKFLAIRNESDVTIHYYLSANYPDTTLTRSSLPDGDVSPHELGYTTVGGEKRDEFVRKLTDETLIVFIVDEDSLKVYGFDTIASKGLILKRYDYTLSDLENLNWEIQYK